MLRKVMDDHTKLIGTALVARNALRIMLVAIAGVSFAATPAEAQQFSAKVLDTAKSAQRITVPINRSVTVETTQPITRANVVAEGICDVQVLTPTRLLISGQSYGHATVALTGEDGSQYVLEVQVELDLAPFNDALKKIDPLSTAKAESLLGNIVLTGTTSSLDRAQRMVDLANLYMPTAGEGPRTSVQNHLIVAGEQQVKLNCTVAEVSRSAARDLGINGFLAGDNFKDGFLVNQLGGINPINIGAAADALVTNNIPFLTDQNGIPIAQSSTLSLGFPRVQMQLFIRAMADNNLLKILAQPNLTAISGEEATFLAGGEFPIPVPQGNQQVTIEFREFGIRLNFTPVVQGQQQIRLRVRPEVSELDFTTAVQIEGFVVPGLTSRAAETTVEIGNGQTIVMAGLLSEEVRGIASRVPGIGDVPVLGALFRSVNFQRSMTELVIMVTPEIVAPLDAHQRVKLPGEDMKDPKDWELYMMGMLEGETASAASAPDGNSVALESDPDETSVHGPWGHEDSGR